MESIRKPPSLESKTFALVDIVSLLLEAPLPGTHKEQEREIIEHVFRHKGLLDDEVALLRPAAQRFLRTSDCRLANVTREFGESSHMTAATIYSDLASVFGDNISIPTKLSFDRVRRAPYRMNSPNSCHL